MPGVLRRGPFARPSMPLRVLADPRKYLTTPTSGSSTLYNPIASRKTDLYSLVVGGTPGLVHWWRFNEKLSTWGGSTSNPPYFANSVGAATLWSPAAGPTLGPSLIAGERSGGSVRLNNHWLEGFDYFVHSGCHEIGSFEVWVRPVALDATFSTIVGAWDGTNGWRIGVTSSGAVHFLIGSQALTGPASEIVNGRLYHIVAVVGGTDATPDYLSRLYVNGREVVNGSPFSAGQPVNTTSGTAAARLGVGNCDGGAFNLWDAYIDEVAIYSRMLQPAEVLQHYQAAFARG